MGRDKEIGLQLAMPDNGNVSRDLGWYLQGYFRDQTLSGVDCDSVACTSQQGVYKKGDRKQSKIIIGGPEILVIQLARMRWVMGKKSMREEKVRDQVEYFDRLDLSDYSDGYLSYQLNGIVAHSGSTLSGGHYVAMVRSQKGDDFVICNDSRIDETKTKEQVLEEAVGRFESYLLVYQKTGGRMARCI